MIDKQTIILGYFREGKRKKKLAKELGISPNTVRKHIEEYEQELALSQGMTAPLPLTGIINPPAYDTSKRSKRKLTEEVREQIDAYLDQNLVKRHQGKHKQQMLKKDMHHALLKKGYQIGYTTVCDYIRLAEHRSAEVFIRQHYEAGQAVEFDWAEVKLTINGGRKKLMLAVFTSCYSNHRWGQLFFRQDMSSFLHSHSCYFAYTGGVPRQMVYDNMRTAVRKFTTRSNAGKQPTEDLLKMSCYYQFDYRFCNTAKGNEKGHVERSVEYVRRKAFAPKDVFDSIDAANEHLWQVCVGLNQLPVTGKTQSIQEDFELELQHMKVAPAAYDTAELRNLRVDKYSCIKVDTNWYSVPEGFVGHRMDVKVYPNEILVYNPENQCIAMHNRRHTRFEYFLDIDHYLKTLRTKPGALRGSLTLFQADEALRNIFSKHFATTPRDFVELLLYAREQNYDVAQLQDAIDSCLACCPHHPVSLDKLKILLNQKQGDNTLQQPANEFSQSIARHCHQQLQAIQSLIS